METASSGDKDLQYACHSIHDFFDCFDFPSSIKYTERIIMAASLHKFWFSGYPYRFIFFMEKLQELVEAAFVLKNHYSCREACLLKTKNNMPGLVSTKDYTDGYSNSNPWNNMPRHLTAVQYTDPFIAIEKFTSHKTEPEWKQVCKELAEFTLCNESIEEQYSFHELLLIRRHMLRLIEACHLIEVRSGKKIRSQELNQE